MRLLSVDSFEIIEFGSSVPPYAILSHTWGKEEVSFVDLVEGTGLDKKGYAKVRDCCRQTKLDGLEYVWIDTCCIDKRSSSELSEAINSMFQWYRDAVVCYAYLEDIQNRGNFTKSRWFTRGWTLQELLAPRMVTFFLADWTSIGTRDGLRKQIAATTNINLQIFTDGKLSDFCVAQKMSWASHRETTRIEDQAYCLLGIFGVTMALVYGEGERAFLRLQEEIMKHSDDQSIFAWQLPRRKVATNADPQTTTDETVKGGLLARSPGWFVNSGAVVGAYSNRETSPFSITNKGLQMSIPIISAESNLQVQPVVSLVEKDIMDEDSVLKLTVTPADDVAILNCHASDNAHSYLAIYVEMDESNNTYRRVDCESPLGSVSGSSVLKHAKRKNILVRSHNLTFGELLWRDKVPSKLMIIQLNVDSSASFSFKATDVYPEQDWRKQQTGGLSFPLRSALLSSQLLHKTSVTFQDSDGYAFILVLDPVERTHGEIGLQILGNIEPKSDASADEMMANTVPFPSTGYSQSSAAGKWHLVATVKDTQHAIIVFLSAYPSSRSGVGSTPIQLQIRHGLDNLIRNAMPEKSQEVIVT